jgi:hypothetical protein
MAADKVILCNFCHALLHNQSVTDPTYAHALAEFGEPGVVEAASLVGYYSFLAMVMNMARAVRLHGGQQLSKEAMDARPLFPALVSTCLLSLAEPICRDGRNLVEYPPSPAPDGLQLAVADVIPRLPPFNVRVTSRGSGQ